MPEPVATASCPSCRRLVHLDTDMVIHVHVRIPGFPSQGWCASSGTVWSETIFPARLDTPVSND